MFRFPGISPGLHERLTQRKQIKTNQGMESRAIEDVRRSTWVRKVCQCWFKSGHYFSVSDQYHSIIHSIKRNKTGLRHSSSTQYTVLHTTSIKWSANEMDDKNSVCHCAIVNSVQEIRHFHFTSNNRCSFYRCAFYVGTFESKLHFLYNDGFQHFTLKFV